MKEAAKNVVFQRATTHNDKPQNVCQEPMRELFQRHCCLPQASRGELAECMQLLLPSEAEEEHGDGILETWNASSVALAPGPVHQLSCMWEQGFGRIIAQGVRTCTLAALLNRPCLIDPLQDKCHNFSAFLQPGPLLNWEMASRVVVAQNNVNIGDALHKMPQGIEQGHGWESLVGDNTAGVGADAATKTTTTTNQQSGGAPEHSNVLPMAWGRDKKTINDDTIGRHVGKWDGQNARHGHKVLLSPNFGDAWHGYGQDCMRLGGQINKRFKPCANNHMKTFLQNEMFAPSSLAYELHLERRAVASQEKELEEQLKPDPPKNKKCKRRQKETNSNNDDNKVLTTSSGLSARTTLPPHGAIHLQMNILNQDMHKMDVSQEQVLEGPKACFQSLSKDRAFCDLRWWLISDNVEVAEIISNEMDNVHSYAASSVPAVDSATSPTEKKTLFKGVHSGDAIGQKFGQGALAPSMIDWMALHESHISLVTCKTAYGETGATGNGKIQDDNCGGIVEGKKMSFPMFCTYK